MVSGPAAAVLAVMVVFGVATAAVLALMVRDIAARLAEGRYDATIDRLAVLGPAVYLLGFLTVAAGTVLDVEASPLGVGVADVGMVVVVLGAVPMALAFHRAWQAGRTAE